MPAATEATAWCDVDTPIGRCRLEWSARGLTRLRLPESPGTPDETGGKTRDGAREKGACRREGP